MKIANIMPVCFLKTHGKLTNYHMVLTHLFRKNTEYNKFYKERGNTGDFIMLDSSVLETGFPSPLSTMVDIANYIKASELILPDVLKNKRETIRKTKEALLKIKKVRREINPKIKFMAVPQGNNSEEWINCLKEILELDEISTIGIPRHTQEFEDLKEGRYELIKKAMGLNLLPTKSKNYHLLGMGNTIEEEIKIASKFKFIRGVDSRYATICAVNGLNIYEGRGENWEYDFLEKFDIRNKLIKKNIDDLKKELKY